MRNTIINVTGILLIILIGVEIYIISNRRADKASDIDQLCLNIAAINKSLPVGGTGFYTNSPDSFQLKFKIQLAVCPVIISGNISDTILAYLDNRNKTEKIFCGYDTVVFNQHPSCRILLLSLKKK